MGKCTKLSRHIDFWASKAFDMASNKFEANLQNGTGVEESDKSI